MSTYTEFLVEKDGIASPVCVMKGYERDEVVVGRLVIAALRGIDELIRQDEDDGA